MSTTAWIVVGVATIGFGALIVLTRARNRSLDVGSVSDMWVAQHRADTPHDQ